VLPCVVAFAGREFLKPLEAGTWEDGGDGADGHRLLKSAKKQ